MAGHAVCRTWRSVAKASEWRPVGGFVERTIEQQRICAECGAPRPIRIRRIAAVQKKSLSFSTLLTAEQRALAAQLFTMLRQRRRLKVPALTKKLGGIKIELALETLAESAPLLLTYRDRDDRRSLEWIEATDMPGLEELARPGAAKKKADALAQARSAVFGLKHPEAAAIAELLRSDAAAKFDDRIVRVLAALARLVSSGEVRPARAFSSEALGDSKALAQIRARVERLVGPLGRLGVRDNGAAVLIGGKGTISINGNKLDLSGYRYLGFASQDLGQASDLNAASQGLLVVENLTAFHSCIDQLASQPVTIVWSGGFPSSGVLRIIQLASAASAKIRVWCDLDLGGVRIARLIREQTNGTACPALMSSELAASAPISQPLSADQVARIKRDLEASPNAFLSDTLRAILERSAWVEQETLLHLVPTLA